MHMSYTNNANYLYKLSSISHPQEVQKKIRILQIHLKFEKLQLMVFPSKEGKREVPIHAGNTQVFGIAADYL